tara:strand:- start:919 stop:1701 length:783 start_codon:yes stop_codon:yes gene_type:complete
MEFVNKIIKNKVFITIIIVVVILMLCFGIYRVAKYLYLKKKTLIVLVKGVKDARIYSKIELGDQLDTLTPGLEYTFSGWFYIKDLDYKYGRAKHLFHLGDPNGTNVSPGVWLHPKNNNLIIRMHTHNRGTESLNPDINLEIEKNCDIENIEVQRWMHLAIVLQNKTLDVYINGQLRRSCTYKNVPKTNNTGSVHINKDGGFDGIVSDLFYSNIAYSAPSIHDIYRAGHNNINLKYYFAKLYPSVHQLKANINNLKKCIAE